MTRSEVLKTAKAIALLPFQVGAFVFMVALIIGAFIYFGFCIKLIFTGQIMAGLFWGVVGWVVLSAFE